MGTKTNTIVGAEVFDVGRHNNIDFSEKDLDGIVSCFAALDLSGRIPLKLGHSGKDVRVDDGAPALGWVTKLYRRGTKLLADFSDVADELVEGIRKGRWRFVSVELLRNVQAGSRILPWCLDAIAVLGSAPPALGSLAPLKASRQRQELAFDEVFSFTCREDDDQMSEALTALTKKHIGLLFEAAIKDGRVLVRDREMFLRQFPDADVAAAEAFIAQTPKPRADSRRVVSMGGSEDRVSLSSRADHQVMEKVTEYFDEQRTKGKPLPEGDFASILAAAKEVFKRNPDLAQAWKDAPGES